MAAVETRVVGRLGRVVSGSIGVMFLGATARVLNKVHT